MEFDPTGKAGVPRFDHALNLLPLSMADYAVDFLMEAVDTKPQAPTPPALLGPRENVPEEPSETNIRCPGRRVPMVLHLP